MRFALSALAALAVSSPAAATTTLTFETVQPATYCSPITRSGFEISTGLAGQCFSETDSATAGLVSNGTGILLASGGLFIRAVSGNPFSIVSFDAAPTPGAGPGAILSAIGFDAYGNTTGALFAPFSGFQEFNGLPLGNIAALFLVSRTADGSFATYELDNIVLDDPRPPAVPEPSAWLMLLAGFALVGAALRSRPSLHSRGRGKRIPSGASTA